MASTAPSHPSFGATRPYSNTLHGKLPERSQPSGFGHTSTREAARLERERQERERAQRERDAQAAAQGGPSNLVNNITEEQREEINEAFGLFDLDKDQRIDYHEFKVALKALGFDLPKAEIIDLLTQHGISPSNPPPPSSSRPHQHAPPPPQNPAQRDPRDEILRAFALFDTEDKGMINIEDLRRVARELGEGLEEDELQAMIEEFDLEGKGVWGGRSLWGFVWARGVPYPRELIHVAL
ncbi:putative Centrin-3 [Halenospora varia]|nr:putative Centrin-3 [Halenospora varia]